MTRSRRFSLMLRPGASYLLLVLLLLACGGGARGVGDPTSDDDSELSIPDHPLRGTVFGQAWTFGWGRREAGADSLGTLVISLYPDSSTACDAPAAPDLRLEGSVPPQTGVRKFSVNRSYLSFKDYEAFTFLPARQGSLRIDSVDGSSISGGVVAIDPDSESDLRGTFRAELCP